MLHLGAKVAPLRNRTLPYILKVIQDPETYRSNPRRYAVQSIGSVTYHEQALIEPSIQLLLQLVKRGTETSQFVRKAAYIALSRIGRRYPSFQPILLPYFMYPFQHPMTKESVKWGVVIGLGKMAQSNAQLRVNVTRECFTLCSDPAFRIRWAAIKALGHMCCAIGEAKPDERLEQVTFDIACAFLTHGGSHEVLRDWYGPEAVPVVNWEGFRVVHQSEAPANPKSKFNNYMARPATTVSGAPAASSQAPSSNGNANATSSTDAQSKQEASSDPSPSKEASTTDNPAPTSPKQDLSTNPSENISSNLAEEKVIEVIPESTSGVSTAEPSPVTTPTGEINYDVKIEVPSDTKDVMEVVDPATESKTEVKMDSYIPIAGGDEAISKAAETENGDGSIKKKSTPGVLTEEQWRKDDVYLVQYAATHALALLLRSNPSKWWGRISVEFGKILLNPNVAAMSKAMVMITYGKIAGFMKKDSHFYTAIKALLFELCSNDNILVSEPATYGLVNFSLAHPELYPEVKALVRAKLGGSLELAQPQQLQYYLKTWCKLIVKDFSPMNPRSPVISDQQQLDRSEVASFQQSLFEGGEEGNPVWKNNSATISAAWKSTEKAHTNAPEARGIVSEKEKFDALCVDYSASVLESINMLLTDISSMDDRSFIQNLKALVVRYSAKRSTSASTASALESKTENTGDAAKPTDESKLEEKQEEAFEGPKEAEEKLETGNKSVLDSVSEELKNVIESLWSLDKNLKEAAVSMLVQPALLEDDIWLSNLKLQIFNAASKRDPESADSESTSGALATSGLASSDGQYRPTLSSATSMRLRDQLAQLMSLAKSTTFALDPVAARSITSPSPTTNSGSSSQHYQSRNQLYQHPHANNSHSHGHQSNHSSNSQHAHHHHHHPHHYHHSQGHHQHSHSHSSYVPPSTSSSPSTSSAPYSKPYTAPSSQYPPAHHQHHSHHQPHGYPPHSASHSHPPPFPPHMPPPYSSAPPPSAAPAPSASSGRYPPTSYNPPSSYSQPPYGPPPPSSANPAPPSYPPYHHSDTYHHPHHAGTHSWPHHQHAAHHAHHHVPPSAPSNIPPPPLTSYPSPSKPYYDYQTPYEGSRGGYDSRSGSAAPPTSYDSRSTDYDRASYSQQPSYRDDHGARDSFGRDVRTPVSRGYDNRSHESPQSSYSSRGDYQSDRRDWRDGDSSSRRDDWSRDSSRSSASSSYDSRPPSSSSSMQSRDQYSQTPYGDRRDTQYQDYRGRDTYNNRDSYGGASSSSSPYQEYPPRSQQNYGQGGGYDPNPPRQQQSKRGSGWEDQYPDAKRPRY